MSKLTPEEIGQAEFDKCWNDKAWFRGIGSGARAHAASRGAQCAGNMISATTNDALGRPRTESDFIRFQRDAIMFARMAHKGWRAYRVMAGE